MSRHPESQPRYQPLAAALLFAVSLVAAFQLDWSPPDFNASNATWTAFWNVRSHRISEIVSGYAFLVAGAALIWFASLLARRVGSRAAYAAAWAAAGTMWISTVLVGAVAVAKSISGAPSPGADVARLTVDMGADALGMVAAPLVGFLFVAACVAGRRSRTLSRPVAWSGVAVAVAGGIGGIAMLPMLLLPLWPLLVGAGLALRRGEGVTAAPAAA